MSSGEEDDASASESGEDEELHSLLGAFASYHRVQKQSDVVPEGVNVRFGVGGRDARVFASRTSLEFEVNRWDADELGSSPVVHTWDLTPAAADRLNRELLPAALREAATREGLVVSNRGTARPSRAHEILPSPSRRRGSSRSSSARSRWRRVSPGSRPAAGESGKRRRRRETKTKTKKKKRPRRTRP
jgi:hypothetical protein